VRGAQRKTQGTRPGHHRRRAAEGDRRAIIGDFYQGCVADVPEKTRRFIEDALITEGGFRNSYLLQDALDQGQLTEPPLRQLVDRRLPRIDHELGADRGTHPRPAYSRVREHRDRERERIRALQQRKRQRLMGAVVVVLLFIGGLLFYLWQSAQTQKVAAERAKQIAEDERGRADTAAKRAENQQKLAEAATDRAINSLKETERAKQQEALAAASAKRAADAATAALRDAVAGKLVMESRAILDGQRPTTTDIALLLAAAAYRLKPNNEAYSVLHYALDATPGQEKVVVFPDPVIAVSPDGGTAVTARDNTLRLWHAATGQPRGAPLKGHTSRVQSVAFSPDGKTLVSASSDRTLRLWDVTTGKPRWRNLLQRHPDYVQDVAFSSDGTTLVSDDLRIARPPVDAATGQPQGAPLQGTRLRRGTSRSAPTERPSSSVAPTGRCG
jgi:hypothetical protein